jgi:DNA-binding transcriptional LysR family regulator
MISLDNVRVFVRTVESGSFSAAARRLRMTPAVVSYRIQSLEDSLGSRLFTRTTRSMNLTEAGQVFLEHCREVMAAVERAEASVAAVTGASARGTLHITAPLGLGRQALAPMVARYRALQPNTDVRLRLSDHLLDLVREGVDLAIRMARMEDSSFTLRKIAEIRRVLCASPAYLERRGAPQTPYDLANHDCLLLRFPGSQQYRWTLVHQGDVMTVPISGPLDADDGDVLTQWALDGLGIVLKPLFEVAAHIAAGSLVELLPDAPPQSVTLGILYPSRRMLPPRTKTFMDLAADELRGHVESQLAGLAAAKGR